MSFVDNVYYLKVNYKCVDPVYEIPFSNFFLLLFFWSTLSTFVDKQEGYLLLLDLKVIFME